MRPLNSVPSVTSSLVASGTVRHKLLCIIRSYNLQLVSVIVFSQPTLGRSRDKGGIILPLFTFNNYVLSQLSCSQCSGLCIQAKGYSFIMFVKGSVRYKQ